ncbi:hypothetical protein Glove_271g32 [Diversispora epigaea]|uniref:Uncharacterized protein n=1 Tax=Diversispora epigaea TaxID=1348612 RepID=A0A397ICB1_9GLOM|nr:hypothetical protein Glove_271g32 [Diversispora epigaea]
MENLCWENEDIFNRHRLTSMISVEEENDDEAEEVEEVMDQLKVEIYEDICKEIALCWVWVKMVIEVFNEKLFLDPKSKKSLKRIGDGKSLLGERRYL